MGEVRRGVLLAPVPESIGAARAFVHAVVADVTMPVPGDAELLTSELVTNAIRYGGDRIELHVVLAEDSLTVSVHDDGRDLPQPTDGAVPREAVSGRGLQMVAQVADSWGVTRDDGRAGKDVWFRIAVAVPLAPAPPAAQSDRGTEVL